ncbi:MAG: ribosomal RNA small subunit methyltransferase A [Candidatus Nealsonbacteria bacterium]|nr:ribosomal RNA small subunit methyltransferase A [Candidatus Nealsonbacteria bacterium]
MDLSSKKNVKNLLFERKIRPKKALGQNFLISRRALCAVTKAAELSSDDIVLEIGPGIGNLTQELAKKAEKVITIEKDKEMIGVLRETLADFNNVELIHGDILKLDPKNLTPSPYKLVANLPYYIVAPVIRKFLESAEVQPPRLMVLMVQKEVAQRICSRPPDMNLLAISVQFYAEPKIISYVPKNAFWPQPKVDSAIIRLRVGGRKCRADSGLFFRIARAGFSHPRKQLLNNLSQGMNISRETAKNWLLKNALRPTQRAETLNLQDWLNLAKSFKIN